MPGAESSPTWIAVGRDAGGITAALLNDEGGETARMSVTDLPSWVADAEAAHAPRWVWSDTPTWYDGLLAAGVRVARCHDLRLCHAILRDSLYVTDAAPLRAAGEWDAAAPDAADSAPTLFELETASAPSLPQTLDATLAEFGRQREALAGAAEPGRLRLLLAGCDLSVLSCDSRVVLSYDRVLLGDILIVLVDLAVCVRHCVVV